MKKLLKNISPFNNRTEMPAVLFIVKKLLAFCLCYIAGAFIAEGAIIALHFAFGKNMLVGDVFAPQTMMLITYYGYFVMAAVAVLYWRCIEKKPLSEMGMTKRLGSYLLGVVVGIALLSVAVFAIVLTGSIKYNGIFENIDVLMIALFLGGFIIQGATEEILCRGIVFHSLKSKTSVGVAAAVSAAVFIVPHLTSLFDNGVIYGMLGIVNLILISCVFSLLTVRFNSIWASCGLHSFWNAALYTVFGLNLSGNDESVAAVFNMASVGKSIWNGGEYGIEASIITSAVLAAFVVLLWLSGKKKATAR